MDEKFTLRIAEGTEPPPQKKSPPGSYVHAYLKQQEERRTGFLRVLDPSTLDDSDADSIPAPAPQRPATGLGASFDQCQFSGRWLNEPTDTGSAESHLQ